MAGHLSTSTFENKFLFVNNVSVNFVPFLALVNLSKFMCVREVMVKCHCPAQGRGGGRGRRVSVLLRGRGLRGRRAAARAVRPAHLHPQPAGLQRPRGQVRGSDTAVVRVTRKA